MADDAPDEVIHQSTRLKIAATLHTMAPRELMDFNRLAAVLKTTNGNLGSHLNALEKAGYISVDKDFVGKRPRTSVALTAKGRKAFERHVAYLRDLLGDV